MMADTDRLGMVHVITGPGKGKTSAAFGMALRAAGHGLRVFIIQFLKTAETTGEVRSIGKVEGVTVRQFGTGNFVEKGNLSEADRVCARKGMELARQVVESAGCDLLVLDEVATAVHFGLLSDQDDTELLKSRTEDIEVVLTGRYAPPELIELADYVSYVDEKKHPYERGVAARKGIEW
jgi:cob(I)alamin adenosyltransferase